MKQKHARRNPTPATVRTMIAIVSSNAAGADDRFFLFADGGEGPSGGGDGLVEASELQVLIFPESHPRGSALSRLMADHVLKEHDLDGNGRVDKAELFAFHKKGGP